jgi:hypothetical protein
VFGKNPKSFFLSAKKKENRFQINSKVKASILFSARMDQLGYWLKLYSLVSCETQIIKEMNIKNINLKKNLNFDGLSYQTSSFLKKSISYFFYNKNQKNQVPSNTQNL